MSTLVMKFGGSSLGTAAALKQVLGTVANETGNWDQILLVVSALDGVTDMLFEAAQLARIANLRGYRRIAANLRSRHLAIIEQLPLERPDRDTLQAEIDRLLSDVLDHCRSIAQSLNEELSPAYSDAVLAAGERLSARIVAALLRQHEIRCSAVDGADILVTDDAFGNANPDLALTRQRVEDTLLPMLRSDMIPVVTGFIGATPAGETTTLGRGGTDFTASALGALLNADELWIWTSVDGMMSADPHEFASARVIAHLNYDEAADLAYFGARLLHSRMIAPLAAHRLPIRIKNIALPAQTGTLVSADEKDSAPAIKAVTSVHGLSLRRPGERVFGGRDAAGRQYLIQDLGHAHGSDDRVAVGDEQLHLPGDPDQHRHRRRRPLAARADGAKMAEYPQKMPWQIQTVGLVTAIGSDLQRAPHLQAQLLGCLEDIKILGLALGASNCSFTIAVPPSDSARCRAAHPRVDRQKRLR